MLGELITNIVATSGVLASILWILQAVSVFRHRSKAVLLADLPELAPPDGWPLLAVVFAARDEEREVEAATRSMVLQDYPDLEVIAVDDRSTDATGSILDQLAAEFTNLRVVHVHDLPANWLGKNHALQVASESTRAPWILFTDADVVFAPGALKKAVGEAIRDNHDHMTVIPEIPTEGPGERMFLSLFNLCFQLRSPLIKVHNQRKRASIGIGAFNLVRASAFKAIGGFQRLNMSIDDDMRLGQALKWAGYSSRLLLGRGTVSVRWHVGYRRMIRGLEKNFFAALDFSITTVVFVILMLTWVGVGPHLGLFFGPWWTRAICSLGLGALAFILQRLGQSAGIRWYYALFLPLSVLMLSTALIRSTWFTLRRGGVTWRDHHYPIHLLKLHAKARDRWLKELWLSTR